MNEDQRIIFDVPEDTTPGIILSDILKKNGVKNPLDDLLLETVPRLVIVSNAVKDLFNKKISEKNLQSLLKEKLKISEENSKGVLKDIKEKLIPFAKKIIIGDQAEEKKPITAIPTRLINESQKTAEKEKLIAEEPIMPIKTKKTIAIKEEKIPSSPKKTDNYREPIE